MAGFTSYAVLAVAVALPAAGLYAANEFSGIRNGQVTHASVSGKASLPVWQISRPTGEGCALSSSPSPRLARLELSKTCRGSMPGLYEARGWQMMAGGDIVVVSSAGEPLVSFSEAGNGMWEANWPPTSDLQLLAPSS